MADDEPTLQEMVQQRYTEIRDQAHRDIYANLEDEVREIVKYQREGLVAHILGFAKRTWGGKSGAWEIDHCNGRSGNSFIGEQLKPVMEPVCQRLVEEAMKDWEPDEGLLQAVRDEYSKRFKTYVMEYAYDKARDDARDFVDDLLGDLNPELRR